MTDYELQHYVAFYASHWNFDTHNLPKEMPEKDFFTNWIAVKGVDGFSMNEVWHNMQGEVWSPNGEAREHISKLGLYHTSMSTGDVIFNKDTKKYYWVSRDGFTELVLTN